MCGWVLAQEYIPYGVLINLFEPFKKTLLVNNVYMLTTNLHIYDLFSFCCSCEAAAVNANLQVQKLKEELTETEAKYADMQKVQ